MIEFCTSNCNSFLIPFSGPKLPFQLSGSVIVSTPNANSLLLIGGYNWNESSFSSAIYELSGDSINSLQWTLLQHKLRYPREGHLAFHIPDDIF